MSPFKLTEDLLSQIIYGMENQQDEFLLHPRTGALLPEKEIGSEGVPLPPWGPADGYQLMHSFVTSLVNPLYQNRLRYVLKGKNGVFRRFKSEMKENPEIQRLWREFKSREMRKKVISWLAQYKEMVILTDLGEAQGEEKDPPLTDFSIHPAGAQERGFILSLDDAAIREERPYFSSSQREIWKNRSRRGRVLGGEREILLFAADPAGETTGFCWAPWGEDQESKEIHILQIYVLPACRGLGLGTLLLNETLALAKEQGAERITMEIPPGEGNYFTKELKLQGFKPLLTIWGKKQP